MKKETWEYMKHLAGALVLLDDPALRPKGKIAEIKSVVEALGDEFAAINEVGAETPALDRLERIAKALDGISGNYDKTDMLKDSLEKCTQ